MIGQTVSHYRILESLGEGGMGTVYLAEDTHLGRKVAVKFPSMNSDSHDYRARFLREARAVSELSHPGIATLFDYGETEEGRPFLVMELARGRPLTDLMQNGELTLHSAVRIISDIASALVEAHARGVVHRDIKPSNIMIDDRGQVKVLDFGLAKQLNKDQGASSEPEARTLLSTETRSGVVLGTPAYLSPEQAVGGAVDGRSDLFALGTLLYEAITGRTPFGGNSFIEIAANVLHVEPSPPSKINRAIPPQLDFITLKALAKKPNKRYQTAKEFIADLEEVKKRVEESGGQTLIRRIGGSSITAPGVGVTLSNLSQILQRPRIPISYILIGVFALIAVIAIVWKVTRPTPYVPPAEAKRWYDTGTAALRDGAYFQASQAFERAIAIDDGYMLAHARLAEALVELDYVDRAKDELLRVSATDRAALPERDSLYLDAITATTTHDYPKAVELYKKIVEQTPDAEKPHVLVDLGYAYERNQDTKKAIEAYTEATNRNTQYATAFLRLGILYGREKQLASSIAAFDKAEAIYQAMGNLEGRTEVVYQRGALFNQLNMLSDASTQLNRALTLAKAGDQTSQQIKALLQLSTVAVDGGDITLATSSAREAVELAKAKGMENLSAQGLVDLGYSFLIRGDFRETENFLFQALESAQRAKARRNEARARFAIGSLRDQQNNPDEVVKYVQPALTFYQQGSYRSEMVACLSLLARANMQKGDYAAVEKSHRELLQFAQELKDQSLIALAHAERGTALLREEKYSEALEHFDESYSLYSSQGIRRSMGFSLLGRSEALWSMGHNVQARELLEQAKAIATNPAGELKQLFVAVKLLESEMALSEGRFADAKSEAEKVLAVIQSDSPELAVAAKTVMTLASAYGGAMAGARQAAAEAVNRAGSLNNPWRLAKANLAQAETMLLSGDSVEAQKRAAEAAETFKRFGQHASEWRALTIAAEASQKIGDKTKASEYAMRARDSLSKLEPRWGSENYRSYLNRADVVRLRKLLDQLTGSPG
ncbi:MAG TPA: protein kinase [Pyrinomonadaceae bacterium]|nr:protein kinase [Pyrinomonadaceae bacterium]